MKRYAFAWLMAACLLLTGCASLLERTYSTAEPHSSRFWESEADDTLRAENYQDVVNDLLILIGQHAETATLRLYHFEDDLAVAETLERAAAETQQETPLGAYAVEYITSSSQAQGGYYEAFVQIGYRRSAEQIQALANATSPEGVYSLLSTALDEGKTELAVRISYWGTDGQAQVESAVDRIREERGLTETPEWQVYYYPSTEQPGLVEFLFTSATEETSAVPEIPVQEEDGTL